MYVLPRPGTHLCRRRKKQKNEKKMKKVKKSVKMAWSPESSPKSHKTNGLAKVPNGPFQGDVNFWSKFDEKWRFLSSNFDEKPCMKLRILVFMNNDFSNQFWQKHTFCCMICTIFWKVCRSKSPLEEPLQCTKSTLT